MFYRCGFFQFDMKWRRLLDAGVDQYSVPFRGLKHHINSGRWTVRKRGFWSDYGILLLLLLLRQYYPENEPTKDEERKDVGKVDSPFLCALSVALYAVHKSSFCLNPPFTKLHPFRVLSKKKTNPLSKFINTS